MYELKVLWAISDGLLTYARLANELGHPSLKCLLSKMCQMCKPENVKQRASKVFWKKKKGQKESQHSRKPISDISIS